ncbi:uridine kinase family protein [Prauserella aidingensis]|uniref:uridine kinase family protein n=1 Tax=Prauserella aidingensis TaxID=387890 RepID=UPI0020A43A4A|nr:uridine kinase [Prauserella aidingensis]
MDAGSVADPAGDLAARVLAAPPRLGAVRLLAIDGRSGAGKSHLAALVVDVLRRRGADPALVSTDDFATWDDPVSWWPRLATGVLDPLAAGEPGRYRRTEWTAAGEPVPGAEVDVPVPGVLVLEGVSSGRRSVRGATSVLCWLDHAGSDARLARAVARDGEWSRPHLQRWQRFETGWFAVDEPWNAADVTYSSERSNQLGGND